MLAAGRVCIRSYHPEQCCLAAQYNTWLFIQWTPKGVVIFSPFSSVILSNVANVPQAGFQSPVYYMLVDVWRSGSEKLPDAIRSYKTHVASRKAKPDWKGFVIGIFGLDIITPLLSKRSGAAEASTLPAEAAALLAEAETAVPAAADADDVTD